MKKIYFLLLTLFAIMIGMVYLYFSQGSNQISSNENSLKVAVNHSGLIFCVKNDRDILQMMTNQEALSLTTAPEINIMLRKLQTHLLTPASIRNLLSDQNIYISIGEEPKALLITTDLKEKESEEDFLATLKQEQIIVDRMANGFLIHLPDSTVFYVGIVNKSLIITNTKSQLQAALKKTKNDQFDDFVSYITKSNTFRKNNFASLYIDFNRVGKERHNSFASLNYNFSKDKLFFNGTSIITEPDSYYNLFANMQPQSNRMIHMLPDNTLSFTVYSLGDYSKWQRHLDKWLNLQQSGVNKAIILTGINQKYRLDMQSIFPKYFKEQFIDFQTNQGQQLGAIQISDGEKVNQLLIDISDENTGRIKQLIEPDLLYCFFGAPFASFIKPYYVIIDNYMVFSNDMPALTSYLEAYKQSKLLINSKSFKELYDQMSYRSNVTVYRNHMVYQLTGAKDNFQTNLVIYPE